MNGKTSRTPSTIIDNAVNKFMAVFEIDFAFCEQGVKSQII